MDARATAGLLRFFRELEDDRAANVSHSLANVMGIGGKRAWNRKLAQERSGDDRLGQESIGSPPGSGRGFGRGHGAAGIAARVAPIR